MAVAQTCPLLVWLSIKHYQPVCARKYEIMSLKSNQSNVCQGLLKVSTSSSDIKECFINIIY